MVKILQPPRAYYEIPGDRVRIREEGGGDLVANSTTNCTGRGVGH